jgi:hypothetical protein
MKITVPPDVEFTHQAISKIENLDATTAIQIINTIAAFNRNRAEAIKQSFPVDDGGNIRRINIASTRMIFRLDERGFKILLVE